MYRLQLANDLENDRWQRIQEDIYHLLVEGVEARYPREHRLTDVRQLMGRMLDGDLLLTPTLPWLDELQQRLMQRNGDFAVLPRRRGTSLCTLSSRPRPNLARGLAFGAVAG